MKDNPSSAEPRYSYAKPTAKSQPGLPVQLGTNIASYKMSAIDVDRSRRNFPGYSESEYVTLTELQQGQASGTTEGKTP